MLTMVLVYRPVQEAASWDYIVFRSHDCDTYILHAYINGIQARPSSDSSPACQKYLLS